MRPVLLAVSALLFLFLFAAPASAQSLGPIDTGFMDSYDQFWNGTIGALNLAVYVPLQTGCGLIGAVAGAFNAISSYENQSVGVMQGYSDFYTLVIGGPVNAMPSKVLGILTYALLCELIVAVSKLDLKIHM